MGKTLYEKVFDSHTVRRLPSGQHQLLMGLQLLHEVTSPQAFAAVRERGWEVMFPHRNFATVDHIIPTDSQARPLADPLAEEMLAALEKNTSDYGIRLFAGELVTQVAEVADPQALRLDYEYGVFPALASLRLVVKGGDALYGKRALCGLARPRDHHRAASHPADGVVVEVRVARGHYARAYRGKLEPYPVVRVGDEFFAAAFYQKRGVPQPGYFHLLSPFAKPTSFPNISDPPRPAQLKTTPLPAGERPGNSRYSLELHGAGR